MEVLTDARTWKAGFGVILVVLAACVSAAQAAPDITAEPVPGQLEVMQGTAIKLGGFPPEEGPHPESYHWEIVQGQGGVLYDEDSSQVIFQSPRIDSEIELFVIRLTVEYPGQQPAHATAHIRVHQEMSQAKPKPDEPSIDDVMVDFYRREKDAREANRERVRQNQPRVVSQYSYSGFYGGFGYGGPGWGWGYGWGWPARYPIYAPIAVPPPGIDWGPGDGNWGEPIAIPYDDLVATFPGDIADDYLPEDFPGAEQGPDSGSAEEVPTDFIVFPSGADPDPGGD